MEEYPELKDVLNRDNFAFAMTQKFLRNYDYPKEKFLVDLIKVLYESKEAQRTNLTRKINNVVNNYESKRTD